MDRGGLKKIYRKIYEEIDRKCNAFKETWQHSEESVFKEMVFCLMTPQSKAEVCWRTTEEIFYDGSVYYASAAELSSKLQKVRFRNNKARYIVELRNRFVRNNKVEVRDFLVSLGDEKEIRNWLALNIKGYGLKEASHFLRNVGKGTSLAILDRHILRNLVLYNVIEDIPKSLPKNKYEEIENKMNTFSNELGIPLSHLDFVIWYEQTGRIFK